MIWWQRQKAQEINDLISSVEDIGNNEVKYEVGNLEIVEKIRQVKTELKDIQNKEKKKKKSKGKLENKNNKLEEFINTFRKEDKETAVVFHAEIQTLK